MNGALTGTKQLPLYLGAYREGEPKNKKGPQKGPQNLSTLFETELLTNAQSKAVQWTPSKSIIQRVRPLGLDIRIEQAHLLHDVHVRQIGLNVEQRVAWTTSPLSTARVRRKLMRLE